MPKLVLDLEVDLYRMLMDAAQINQHTLRDECMRRLEGSNRRSRYMEGLLAELRADDALRRSKGERTS